MAITKTYQGETFTEVGPGEWRGEKFTTPWDTCEIEDIASNVKYFRREIAKAQRAGDAHDGDSIEALTEQLAEAIADLALLRFLAD